MVGKSFRKYGLSPYTVAVIHGGPGAPGMMAPLAREIAHLKGVLEPFQSAVTIDGQVEELDSLIRDHAELPVTIIGHSWGAWLSYIYTARYPVAIRQLIMIGAGAFDPEYNKSVISIRLERLTEKERGEVKYLQRILTNASDKERKAALRNFGRLMTKADSFHPVGELNDVIDYQPEVFDSVWGEASAMRKAGDLIRLAEEIRCPVVAIHGDYDPHPAEGVKEPLSEILPDFRFILLEKCGHYPWNEKYGRDDFFRILKELIK